MSFILDALKKSERERQRTAVPGISDLPVVVESRQSLPWAGVTIAAMLVGAGAFAWVWWQSPATPPAAPPAAAVANDAPAAARPEPVAAPPRAAATPPATRSLSGEATRVAATQRTAPAAAEASPPATTSPASTRPRGTVTDAPMSILEARASGMSVPELSLELLVFSDDPRQRFVYINARKYVEGDTLAAGPRLVEISTEGALLTFNGRTFLLPQN
jgi:general secretion pathway protein B